MNSKSKCQRGEKRVFRIGEDAEEDEVQHDEIDLDEPQCPLEGGVDEEEEDCSENGEMMGEIVAFKNADKQKIKSAEGNDVDCPQGDKESLIAERNEKLKQGSPKRQIEIGIGEGLSVGEGGGGFEVIVIIAIAESLAQDVEINEHDKKEARHKQRVACIYFFTGEKVEQHAQQNPC